MKFYFVAVILLVFAVADCGKNVGRSRLSGALSGPTQAELSAVQVSPDQPCLSLPKLENAVWAAPQSRSKIYDIEIPDGARPISQAFYRSVVRNSVLLETSLHKTGHESLQSDCKQLEFEGAFGGPFKLITATPTTIETETREFGKDSERVAVTVKYKVEYRASGRIYFEVSAGFTTPHADDCLSQEDHPVIQRGFIDFGVSLLPEPPDSDALTLMKQQAADYDDRSKHDQNKVNEDAYCQKVRASKK